MNRDTAAKKVYICYEQLIDILSQMQKRLEIGLKQKEGYYWDASDSYAKSFNSILKTVKENFDIDKDFLESIKDIKKVEEISNLKVFEDVLSLGSKLRGTLEAFINLYMAPDKKKQIGFRISSEN